MADRTVASKSIVPFLKWPGGKRWFVQRHSHVFPARYKRYFEPFLGAASVFFHLQPKKAVLSDVNAHLISAYRGIKNEWQRLEASLQYRQGKHDRDPSYYHRLRAREPKNVVEQASRFIYLNRTCFNGIYRVNVQGQFNVPRGSKNEVVLATDNFRQISSLLRSAEIRLADFEPVIDEAGAGDLIFADPPYTVRHNLNGFIRYNENLFSWEDQERLARSLRKARNRGAKIVMTNADHASIRKLYSDGGFRFLTVSRSSNISANAAFRRSFDELVILSDTNGHTL